MSNPIYNFALDLRAGRKSAQEVLQILKDEYDIDLNDEQLNSIIDHTFPLNAEKRLEEYLDKASYLKEKRDWLKLDCDGKRIKNRCKSDACMAKLIAKRRKRNKNKKTHRK